MPKRNIVIQESVDMRARPTRRQGVTLLIVPPPLDRVLTDMEGRQAQGERLTRCRWVYGLPLVTDPRDFTPDPNHCTPTQVYNWTQAVMRWDNGNEIRFPAQGDERWGVGISLLRHHDDEYPDPSRDWKDPASEALAVESEAYREAEARLQTLLARKIALKSTKGHLMSEFAELCHMDDHIAAARRVLVRKPRTTHADE